MRSLYAAQGILGASATIRARTGVLWRLREAANHLPTGIALVVFDGYRPLAVQQALYDSFREQIARENPHLSETELTARVGDFVAVPNANPECPPPHRTGGAVDVYLLNIKTNQPLPMGTAPDDTALASETRWYEDHPEEPYTDNRRLLFHCMTSAGFSNYRGEWWHFDYGNQRWANCSGADCAIYGIPAEESGEG